jgi:hypothetical protein
MSIKALMPGRFGRRPYHLRVVPTVDGRIKAQRSTHVYKVQPRKDHRGVDLISDALPFGRLRYGEPNAVTNG